MFAGRNIEPAQSVKYTSIHWHWKMMQNIFLWANRLTSMHIWHTLTRSLLAESVSDKRQLSLNKLYKLVGEEKDTWTARKTLRVPAVWHYFTLGSILEVARGRFADLSLGVSRASSVKDFSQDDEKSDGTRVFSLSKIFGGHTRTAKEPGQRPSNQTLYRRLSFTTRQDIRRQANPRVAGRLSHGCPGEARGFLRILRWLDRAHPHSDTGDATAQGRRLGWCLRILRDFAISISISENRATFILIDCYRLLPPIM